MNVEYPLISRIEGVGPMQYGTKGLLDEKFADIEEKYDLNEASDGFGEEGEDEDGEEAEGEEEGDDNSQDNDSGSEFYEGEAY